MNNKIKFLLLITFGFVFLFAQDSLAGYENAIDEDGNIIHCAAFKENGSFAQLNDLEENKYCIFNQSDFPNWNKITQIRLSLDTIKIPYALASNLEELWKAIDSTIPNWSTIADGNYLTSLLRNPGAAHSPAECKKNDYESFGTTHHQIKAVNLPVYFSIPRIYDKIKTEIIRSCLPGEINTSKSANSITIWCYINYHTPPRDVYGTFYPSNYPPLKFDGCGLRSDENSMSLSTNATLNSENDRFEIDAYNKLILKWGLSNPSARCDLSGDNATSPSNSFERKIEVGEVGINVRTGEITPKSDDFPFENVKRGIYIYTFSCYGVLDGKNSPERGKEEKEIKVFVGDIPPDPEIKDFKIITEGNEDLTDISAIPNSKSKWQIIKGKTFELKWDVENDEYGDENGSPLSIDIFSQTGIEKSKFVASSKIKNNENEPLLIDTSSFETGIYTFTIKVNNDEFPASDNGLEEATFEPIKISVKDLRDVLPNPEINDFEIVEDNKDLIPMPVDSTTEWQIPIGKTFELEWDVKVEYNKYSGPLDISVYLKKGIGDEKLLSSSDIKNNRDNPLKINTSSLRTGTYTFVLRVNNSEFPESEGGPEEAMRKLNILVGNVEDMPLPEVEFSTDKTEIEKDEFATLTWEVADAEKVSIDHNVGNSLSGTANVRPAISTTYTLTAIGFNGASKTKTVRIEIKSASIELPEWEEPEPPPPPPKPFREQEVLPEKDTIDLKVNGVDGPITIESQSKFTLSWNLDKYCLATGSWLKVKLKAGSEDITLKKNGKYTYSLYCPGSGSDTVVVNVVGGTGGDSRSGLIDNLLGRKDKLSEEQMPVAEASISTDQITYSQDITVARGEPTDLYVKVNQDINNDGKTSRDATEGWSSLLTNSGYCLYNIDLARNPAEFKGMVKSPENAKECNVRLGNFTFNNEPGTYRYGIFRLLQNDKKFSNISYVDITVEGPPPPDTAPIINFKIDGNDASEQIIGAPAEYNLIWSVANADSCEASGSWGGEKELEGIQRFVSSVKKNFNYTLTCVGELGTTIKSIALRVVEAPTCSFTALPPTIDKQSAFITDSELSWKCEYAEWCSLEPGVNEEINTYGSIRVSPDQTTTYILTCNNSSVSKSFEAEVIVEE